MSKRFDVIIIEFNRNFDFYFSVKVDDINPLDIEKDMNLVKEFFIEKYRTEGTTKSFINWIKERLGLCT